MGERTELLRVPADLVPNGCTVKDDLILFRAGDSVTAAPNRCRHQGGSFRLIDDCLVCPRHNWRLQPETMRYLSPSGVEHPTYDVQSDGLDIVVSSISPERPWSVGARSRSTLKSGELTVRFLAHACAEIRCGSASIVTDPWLVGPAFTRGWWLAHHPPADWLETLTNADVIYISHNHSDHLNPHTLRRLAAVQPDVPIFVPDFGSGSCELLVRRTGMRNVVSAGFGEWFAINSDTRFMILPDAAGREDSGLLIDYRGHLILNTVDCSNLNNGDLPSKVAVLMSAFAGGASGYPVCWTDLYSIKDIKRVVAHNRANLIAMVKETVRIVNPDIFIPFAGYFTEAHPADDDVRKLNVKNQPQRAIRAAELNPGTSGWFPTPGGTVDVSDGTESTEHVRTRTNWDDEFATYLPLINESLDFVPLQDISGIKRYFDWANFRGDLVLQVIETDDHFQSELREFFVDFRSGAITQLRPAGDFRFLRMRVRATSFRHVLRLGEPWEELSIGFQARFYRDPDQYNFDFWDHMQNQLPDGSPWT